MNATPDIDPTACPGTTRILLSSRASQHLSETGAACFALVARDTYPGDPSRWVILLAPCSLKLAQDAERVAMGKATARPIRPTPAPAMPGAGQKSGTFGQATLPGQQLSQASNWPKRP